MWSMILLISCLLGGHSMSGYITCLTEGHSSSSSLFDMHHRCLAPLAANSLHSGLFRAMRRPLIAINYGTIYSECYLQ